MQDTWGFAHFLENTDGVARTVLCALLCGSLVSWYLIVQRMLQHLRRQRQTRHFLRLFRSARELSPIALALESRRAHDPFSQLVAQALRALSQCQSESTAQAPAPQQGQPTTLPVAIQEQLTLALRRAIAAARDELEAGQTWLATVASSAPFVGLLGTVWGIYHALIAIGASGQSTLDKVAGPVGEALIMTGIGLAVAIPAAMAYNAFGRIGRKTLVQLTAFADEVNFCLVRGIFQGAPHGL